MDTNQLSREQKKLATRHSIVLAAHALFASRGYAETTLADIARQAGISPRTIFSYFPSKESIVFELDREILLELEQRLSGRKDQTVFAVLRQYLQDVTSGRVASHYSDIDMNAHRELVQKYPELKQYALNCRHNVEQIIFKATADELQLADPSLIPHMIAAAIRVTVEYIEDLDGGLQPKDIKLLDEALMFVEAGLSAVRR